MPTKFSLTNKAIFLLITAIVLQLSFVFSLAQLQASATNQVEESTKIQSIIDAVNNISTSCSTAASLSLSADPVQARAERRSVPLTKERVRTELDHILNLLNNPADREQISGFENSANRAVDLIVQSAGSGGLHKSRKARAYVTEQSVLVDQLAAQSDELVARLRNSKERIFSAQSQALNSLLICLVIGLVLNLILIIAITYLFAREVASKLAVISDNNMRLADGMILNPPLEGLDEISMLDQAFHKMADAQTAATINERAVIENALDLICSLAAGTEFLTANPAAELILGYRTKALLGKKYLDFVAPEERERTEAVLKRVVGGEVIQSFDHAAVRKNGSRVYLRLSAYWSDTDKSIFGVIYDVTQSRQLESMKKEFLVLTSRGLSGPMSTVIGMLRSLQSADSQFDQDSAMIRINDAISKVNPMLNLISDLLEMEKLDATALKLDLQKLNLSEIIEESLLTVRSDAVEKNIDFNLQISKVTVDGDELRLQEAFSKVLLNAIRLSPPGSLVGVCCEQDGMARIEVTDCGQPLSVEQQECLFEPFKRVQAEPEEEQFSPELGLAICKNIVEAHHGTIRIISNGAVGNTVRVDIPLQHED